MSPLEKLGLEVAARTLLGGRGRAALVYALIDANGQNVSPEALTDARSKNCSYGIAGSTGIKVRMSKLRAALADIGLPGIIITQPYDKHHKSAGYALPEPGRSALIERLIEEAS